MTFKNVGGPNREGVNPGDGRGLLFNSMTLPVTRGDVGALDFATATAATGWMPTEVRDIVAGDQLAGVACVAEESMAVGEARYWALCGILDARASATTAVGDDCCMEVTATNIGFDPSPGITTKIVAYALEITVAAAVGKFVVDGWNGFGNVD